MSKRDYYEVLGVSNVATDDEIKRAYRKLAKKYHPDVSTEPDATEKFKEVQEAYDILSDSQKRSNYDQFGHAADNFGGAGGGFGGGGFGGGGFEDIFSSFFGGGGGGSRSNQRRRGRDVRHDMNITFEQSIFGSETELELNIQEECTKCGGTGAFSKKDMATCTRCAGTGQVVVEQRTIFGAMQQRTVCPTCQGKGKVITKKCTSCHGKGNVNKRKKIKVSIPAGIDTGQQIRLGGKGEPGEHGEPGDLYIRFFVEKHDLFERQEDDIILEMPITIVEAALGAEMQIPTIYGDVKLKIPAGTQSQTIFKLRGKGVPDVRSGRKGDQLVVIKVITPKNLDKEQKAIFEKLGKTDLTGEHKLFKKINKFKETIKEKAKNTKKK